MKRFLIAAVLTVALMVQALADTWVVAAYGAGGRMFSPGVDTTVTLLRKIPGVTVFGPYQYGDVAAMGAQLRKAPAGTKLVSFGYSCGAGSAPGVAAAAAPRRVAAVIGIQSSAFCSPYPVPANADSAQLTYNPNCWATLWLGCAVWATAPGFQKSQFVLIVRPDSHAWADNDPDAQADVARKVKAVNVAGPKAMLRRAAVPPADDHMRVLVRYHGTW